MIQQKVTIVTEAGYSFAGFIAGQGLRFLFTLLVAKLLGAEYLGIYALALAVVQIAEVLAVGGLDAGVLRYVNLYEEGSDRRSALVASALKTTLLYSLPLTLLLLVFSGSLAYLLNGDKLLQLTLVCYVCSLPFQALIAVGGHAVQGYRKLRPKIIAGQILVPGTMLLLTLLVNAVAGHVPALLFPLPLSMLAAYLWLWRQLCAITGVSLKDVWYAETDRMMLRYAKPLMLVAVLGMVSHWLDILMLGVYAGVETVGLYQPAARTAGLVRSVLLAFAGIAAPMFAAMHSRGEIRELERLFRILSRWVMLAAIPPGVLLLLLPETVLAFFGDPFAIAAPVLVVLTVAVLVQSFFGLYDTILQMTGYSKICFINGIAGFSAHVLLNALFIPRFGMMGAAAALAVVYLLLATARVFQVRVFLGFHAFSFSLLKPVIAGVAAAAALAAVKPFFDTLPGAVSFGSGMLLVFVVYILFVRLMQLEQEELDVILELFSFIKRTKKV